ncbi:hypothetical protein ACIBEA_41185 [Streptomyces sp. NPDC051555]
MMLNGFFDFLLHDVLGNITAAAVITGSSWAVRAARIGRARRRADRQ